MQTSLCIYSHADYYFLFIIIALRPSATISVFITRQRGHIMEEIMDSFQLIPRFQTTQWVSDMYMQFVCNSFYLIDIKYKSVPYIIDLSYVIFGGHGHKSSKLG